MLDFSPPPHFSVFEQY